MSTKQYAIAVFYTALFLTDLINGGQVIAAPKTEDQSTLIEPIPNWQITTDGTATSVTWVDYTPNLRFAIYDNNTPDNDTDDLVLDRETGLVWVRDLFNLPAGYFNPNRAWTDAIYTATGLTWVTAEDGEFQASRNCSV
jgi:hypothetical protein